MSPASRNRILDLFRAWPWLFLAILALVGVLILAPAQAGVLMWSLSKLALGSYLGYWIDRSIFPYARPGQDLVPGKSGPRQDWWMMRRAVVMAAVVIALGLGV